MVDGNAEWLLEAGVMSLMNSTAPVAALTTNIRHKSATDTDRAMPGYWVDALCDQTLGYTNEYRGRLRVGCETHVSDDTTTANVKDLIGAVRDMFHNDAIVTNLNNASNGIVVHDDGVREGESTPDDDNDIRRLIFNADIWFYVGAAS